MNRIVNLKKPSPPAPLERVPAPSPIPRATIPQPAVQTATPPPHVASLPPNVPVQNDPASSSMRWHFSSSTNPRTTMSVIIVCLILGGAFALVHQYLLGLIMGLGGAVFALQSRNHTNHEVALMPHGLVVDGHTYLLKDIKSFWIHYVPGGIQELSVELRRWYLPYLHLPLSGKNPVRIREFFVQFIPEKEHSQSLVDVLLQRLGL